MAGFIKKAVENRKEKKAAAKALDEEYASINGRCDRCEKGLEAPGTIVAYIVDIAKQIEVRGEYCPKCTKKENKVMKKAVAKAIDNENARLHGLCTRCEKGLEGPGTHITSREGSIWVKGEYCPKCTKVIKRNAERAERAAADRADRIRREAEYRADARVDALLRDDYYR